MAQVIPLTNESWAVSWIPATPKTSTTHNCTATFQISGRKPEFSLLFVYVNPSLTLTLTATKADDDLPEKVVAIVDGVTWTMTHEQGKWSAIQNPYGKFTAFYDPRLNGSYNGYCGHQPEVHVTLILHFSVTGEKVVTERMSKLLESGEFADALFVVQGKDVKAHKNIVAAASPVMAAMFQSNNFKEGRTNKVKIDDFDYEVFHQLLLYMYTDAAPLLKKEAITEKLFLAADKYQVEGLKEDCVNNLITKLKLENVVHFLVVGYLHSAPKLQEAALKFLERIKSYVWARPEWKELMKNYPDLFYQACQRMIPNPPAT